MTAESNDDPVIPLSVLEAELEELLEQAKAEADVAKYMTTGTFAQWERDVDRTRAVCAFLHKRLDRLRIYKNPLPYPMVS